MPTSGATAADRRDAVDSISTVGGVFAAEMRRPKRERGRRRTMGCKATPNCPSRSTPVDIRQRGWRGAASGGGVLDLLIFARILPANLIF
jgi:hypothetical protein